MDNKKILITGGDGYLGLRLAHRYLETTDATVILWVRAEDEDEFERKKRRLTIEFSGMDDRVVYHWGNLVADSPFNGINPDGIQTIIHTAAVTRFNVEQETAQNVNVDGTRKILSFASRCPILERFALLSTVYASGLKTGTIDEVSFDGKDGFANYYEWSKWESERLLLEEFPHLPWQILRVATVIADDISGVVTQQNAVHNTLKLFYYGLLSLIPGNRATPLYFITGEFASRTIVELVRGAADRTVYHVTHKRGESISLEQLVDLAYETFGADDRFRMRRVLKPLYSDQESFSLLAEGVNTFASGVVSQAVSSVAPFSPQLFIDKDVMNRKVVSALSEYSAPDPSKLIQRACQYLLRTNWKKGSVPYATH